MTSEDMADVERGGITPPMVHAPPGAMGDVLIRAGTNRDLGMKIYTNGDTRYVLMDRALNGRPVRRFPYNEQGWTQVWQAFATEDPAAAYAYLSTVIDSPFACVHGHPVAAAGEFCGQCGNPGIRLVAPDPRSPSPPTPLPETATQGAVSSVPFTVNDLINSRAAIAVAILVAALLIVLTRPSPPETLAYRAGYDTGYSNRTIASLARFVTRPG